MEAHRRQWAPLVANLSSADASGSRGGLPACWRAPASAGARVWRVLFHRRSSDVRQFTNLGELLARCSQWRWRDKASGLEHHACCGSWTFSDVPSSIAGEACCNCWAQGCGSSKSESMEVRAREGMPLHPWLSARSVTDSRCDDICTRRQRCQCLLHASRQLTDRRAKLSTIPQHLRTPSHCSSAPNRALCSLHPSSTQLSPCTCSAHPLNTNTNINHHNTEVLNPGWHSHLHKNWNAADPDSQAWPALGGRAAGRHGGRCHTGHAGSERASQSLPPRSCITTAYL